MQYLSQEAIQQVAGGINAQLNLVVNTTNPTVATAFGGLVGGIIEGGFADSVAVGNYISANAAGFNLIPIASMVVGNFTITPTP